MSVALAFYVHLGSMPAAAVQPPSLPVQPVIDVQPLEASVPEVTVADSSYSGGRNMWMRRHGDGIYNGFGRMFPATQTGRHLDVFA